MELISECLIKGHRGSAERLFLCQRERRERGGEGQAEASWVAVMAFQGKLRHREMFGSASVQRWPLFSQVVDASSASHTRHNSFFSQSASQHRLSDCHGLWFITPVPATVTGPLPFCKVTTRPLFLTLCFGSCYLQKVPVAGTWWWSDLRISGWCMVRALQAHFALILSDVDCNTWKKNSVSPLFGPKTCFVGFFSPENTKMKCVCTSANV